MYLPTYVEYSFIREQFRGTLMEQTCIKTDKLCNTNCAFFLAKSENESQLYAVQRVHERDSPCKSILVTLEDELSTRNNRERSRTSMADEVAGLIAIEVNFTYDVRG